MGKATFDILALAFDMDGCIFNHGIYDHLKKHQLSFNQVPDELIIQHNQDLLDKLITEAHQDGYKKVICLLGSNRQDYHINKGNGWACAFKALLALADYLKQALPHVEVEVNKYLLADSSIAVAHGNSFDLALSDDPATQHAHAYFDESKFLLTAMHMHVLAAQYPNQNITYRLIDDKNIILQCLQYFYTYHNRGNFIKPSNCNIKNLHYDKEKLNDLPVITGNGLKISFEQLPSFFKNLLNCADIYRAPNLDSYNMLDRLERKNLLRLKNLYSANLLQNVIISPQIFASDSMLNNLLRTLTYKLVLNLEAMSLEKKLAGLLFECIQKTLALNEPQKIRTEIEKYRSQALKLIAKESYASRAVKVFSYLLGKAILKVSCGKIVTRSDWRGEHNSLIVGINNKLQPLTRSSMLKIYSLTNYCGLKFFTPCKNLADTEALTQTLQQQLNKKN